MSKAELKQYYKEYADMVYNLALNYLQNAQEAEEVTQDVFVKLHFKLDSFKGNSSLKTWIYRIAINQCSDYVKSRNTQKRSSKVLRLSTLDGNNAGFGSNFDHPGVALEHKEATQRIFDKLNLLPKNQKAAILLKSIEHLSQKQIAQTLDVSEKSVESLLNRGRKKLKELLKNEG
ncbi:MAG: RNA polymerase sigma factor [Bacteroidia bacterium]